MSRAPLRTRLPRRGRVLLVVVGVLLLVGCTTVRGLLDTEEALESAGYTEVSVGFDSNNGFDQVEVTLLPDGAEISPEEQAERAAEVVWTTFPLRFDILRIELLGRFEGEVNTYTYGEMSEIFGPRAPQLDEKELSDDVVRAGLGIAIVLAVGGLLFLAAVVLAIVFGVRASRRRKAVIPPPWPPVAGPTSGAPGP